MTEPKYQVIEQDGAFLIVNQWMEEQEVYSSESEAWANCDRMNAEHHQEYMDYLRECMQDS